MQLWSKGIRAPESSPALVGLAALFSKSAPPPKPCTGGGGVATPETKAAGGVDKNRGGAEKLRAYWVRGEGAAKIGWGTPGAWTRCVALVSEHMNPEQAKGYCALRNHDATGSWPGDHKGYSPVVEVKAKGDNAVSDGVMVALYAPDQVARQGLPDGTPPGDMHVTLAYLGKVGDVPDPGPLHDVVARLAAETSPIDATISGVGRFSGDDDGDPVYLSVDAPNLAGFRQTLVDALEAAGVPARTDHGFTPHMTLAYIPPGQDTPIRRQDPTPAQFGLLSMAYGPDVWDYPMGAAE